MKTISLNCKQEVRVPEPTYRQIQYYLYCVDSGWYKTGVPELDLKVWYHSESGKQLDLVTYFESDHPMRPSFLVHEIAKIEGRDYGEVWLEMIHWEISVAERQLPDEKEWDQTAHMSTRHGISKV